MTLSVKQVQQIHSAADKGLRPLQIARMLGLSYPTVKRYLAKGDPVKTAALNEGAFLSELKKQSASKSNGNTKGKDSQISKDSRFLRAKLIHAHKEQPNKRKPYNSAITPLVPFIFEMLQFKELYGLPYKTKAQGMSDGSEMADGDICSNDSQASDDRIKLSAARIHQILSENDFFGHNSVTVRSIGRMVKLIQEHMDDPKFKEDMLTKLNEQRAQFSAGRKLTPLSPNKQSTSK